MKKISIYLICILLIFTAWMSYRIGFHNVERIDCNNNTELLANYIEQQILELNTSIQKIPYHKIIKNEINTLRDYYLAYPQVSRAALRYHLYQAFLNISRSTPEWETHIPRGNDPFTNMTLPS